jgi:hypothetical protein
VPGLAAAVGLARLLALVPAVLVFGGGLIGVVAAVAVVLPGFEILLALLLARKRRP